MCACVRIYIHRFVDYKTKEVLTRQMVSANIVLIKMTKIQWSNKKKGQKPKV